MTVFVGPSIWRQMDVRGATAMFAAMASNPGTEQVIWAPLWNDALIGRSRSIMCTEFLKTDADVMVIIDDDVVFEPADFWKIVEGARETRGIYGGAYVTRSLEPHLSSRAYPGTTLDFHRSPQRRPIEIQYLATGFFAFHRDVMEAMIVGEFEDAWGHHRTPLVSLGADRPFYPVFSPFVCREGGPPGQLHYLSEDWAFCNRARQLGFGVWCDQSIILVHMGLYPFTVGDIQHPGMAFPPAAGPSTGVDRMTMAGRQAPTGEPLIDDLVADIATYADEDAGDVRRMLEEAPVKLNEYWRRHYGSETEFYEREDVGLQYILELARWHRLGCGAPLDYASMLAGKRVLDFGAGIGTFALAAVRAGADVYAVEVNPELRSFMQRRGERHVPGPYRSDAYLPRDERQFDVIVAWHVFEHLPDPEAVLDDLLARLAPEGVLVSESGFADGSTASHHLRDDWNDVLASRGLEPDAEHPWIHRQRLAVTA